MPASSPPLRSVALWTARRRPSGVDRSATTSDASLSMPMTFQPATPSRAAEAAPIPEAAPVMTTVRSGSGSRLQEGKRLVGVGAHGDLGVNDVEDGPVGVDDEGGRLGLEEADAALHAE